MIVEKLKQAIIDQDFSLVAEAIKDLTGEEVEVDDDPLQSKLREIQDQINSLKTFKKTPTKSKPKQTKNKFDEMVDDLEIEVEPGEELIDDNVKTTRKPRPSSLVKVVCACGKSEEVSSILARDNYVCQKCLIKKAKR